MEQPHLTTNRQLYFAPLEGITGFAYRNVHHSLFEGADKYFSPFVAPNYTHHIKTREAEDISPANNAGIPLVPQILSNRPDDFLWAAGELYAMGYREINLNLGCPMPTVVRKGRGSGQLRDLDALDRFLEQICRGMEAYGISAGAMIPECPGQDPLRKEETADTSCAEANSGPGKSIHGKTEDRPLRFTIKTRIGIDAADAARNARRLLEIYNRYPVAELTVHPRTQKDLYGGRPDLEIFQMFLENSSHPLVYNGDIFTPEDYRCFVERFPQCRALMMGRGLIANPALAREIRGGGPLRKEELKAFHDAVFAALQSTLPGPSPLLGKMKELWFYMGRNFADADRYLKEIRKAGNITRYQAAVRTLFVQCRFRN